MNNFQKKKENVLNTIYDNLSGFFFLSKKLTNSEFPLFIETYFRISEWTDFFYLYIYTI